LAQQFGKNFPSGAAFGFDYGEIKNTFAGVTLFAFGE
jgi:hypothetical protein